MKLYIDTSNSEEIVVGVDHELIHDTAREQRAQRLLGLIREELEKRNLGLEDVTEIKVNTGPGSFTGLRVGVAVANSLGWSLGVPVNDKDISGDGPIEPRYANT
ncbi:MAG: hypothetical protein HYU80_01785 [Candidatus Blackburnbacteria bacterium]|nr:hypothetical protein [Candidatus Blackburnbacteria bacterium]